MVEAALNTIPSSNFKNPELKSVKFLSGFQFKIGQGFKKYSLYTLQTRSQVYVQSVPKRRGGSRYKLPGPGVPEGGPALLYMRDNVIFLKLLIYWQIAKHV
jgi:hypothetical protein